MIQRYIKTAYTKYAHDSLFFAFSSCSKFLIASQAKDVSVVTSMENFK